MNRDSQCQVFLVVAFGIGLLNEAFARLQQQANLPLLTFTAQRVLDSCTETQYQSGQGGHAVGQHAGLSGN